MNACDPDGPLCLATSISMAMITAGLVFAVLRMLRGPTTADRVIALDLAALLGVGVVAIYTVITGEVTYLTGALVVGLVTFVGTVAFARYLEKTVQR